MRLGRREYRTRVAAGEKPYPKVLDTLREGHIGDSVQQVGVLEIPAERILGVKSVGHTNAFAWNFQSLLSADSEFARKWVSLCAAHFTTDIQEPILCYEYLGTSMFRREIIGSACCVIWALPGSPARLCESCH